MKYLDGDENPDSVVIFTTNYPERFDSALFRPGRIDYRFELGTLPRESVAPGGVADLARLERAGGGEVGLDRGRRERLRVGVEVLSELRDDVAGFARDCVSLSRANPR